VLSVDPLIRIPQGPNCRLNSRLICWSSTNNFRHAYFARLAKVL